MKHIIKTTPPASLESYKATEGACFENMPSDVKTDVRNSLINEQGGICCYCGKRILPDYHSVIEHFFPKGNPLYTHLQLEYSNLLCSCDGGREDRKGKTKTQKNAFPPCCDSKKNNSIINVSPLDEMCEECFSYDEEGFIYGETPEAQATIDVLGLNCTTLVNLRKAAIDPYITIIQNEKAWNQEIVSLSSKHDGLYLPFCFAVIFYIQKYKLPIAS